MLGPVAGQHLAIQGVGLGPAVPLDAGGVHPIILDALGHEVAVKPEAFATGLVATENAGVFREAEALTGPGDFPLQGGEVAGGDDALPERLSQPSGEGQMPFLVASFKG